MPTLQLSQVYHSDFSESRVFLEPLAPKSMFLAQVSVLETGYCGALAEALNSKHDTRITCQDMHVLIGMPAHRPPCG